VVRVPAPWDEVDPLSGCAAAEAAVATPPAANTMSKAEATLRAIFFTGSLFHVHMAEQQ
jgi:hypothetical protein